MDNNLKLEKALTEYARTNGIDKKALDGLKDALPEMKAQTRLLTEDEIAKIKSQLPKEKLSELEQILKSVK